MRTTNMIYVFDIDGTICEKDEFSDSNYENSRPITARVKIVNKLYDEGHTVVYWTARGSQTRLDWYDLTVEQLSEWGAKYHGVKLGKPHYDVFICDKAINSEVYFKGKQYE